VPIDYIDKIGGVMRQADWHTYQVLTKRHERIHTLLSGKLNWMAQLPHVWYGVSVEDREYGLLRIERLRSTPARVRFLSIEPLLEDLGLVNLDGIDWVIVGGESGPYARPIKKEWVMSIFRQCRKQRVPFFFKQWGGARKHETGRLLNGRTYDELP
jgi:protein gp37